MLQKSVFRLVAALPLGWALREAVMHFRSDDKTVFPSWKLDRYWALPAEAEFSTWCLQDSAKQSTYGMLAVATAPINVIFVISWAPSCWGT